MKKNGIKHSRSAPYHPSTNGLAERFVQSMKHALKATQSSGRPLHQRLCSFLLSYRSTAHSTTGVSPCSLFLKREVKTRFDLLHPNIQKHVEKQQQKQKSNHDQHAKFHEFKVGDSVMAKNLRPGTNWVPALVIAKLGPLSYLVETVESKLLWRRHVDHLKKLETEPISLFLESENDEPELETQDEVIGMPQVVLPNATPSQAEGLDNGEPQSSTASANVPATAHRYNLRSTTHPPNYYRPISFCQ